MLCIPAWVKATVHGLPVIADKNGGCYRLGMTTMNPTKRTCPHCHRLVEVITISMPAGDAPAFEMHRVSDSIRAKSCVGSLAVVPPRDGFTVVVGFFS